MRSLLLFACLCIYGMGFGQGSGFTFTYSGPYQINTGPSCMAPLNWGAPGTPTVVSNIPGGVIVSFTIYSISGGYEIGDPVMGGTSVTVFYQAVDNFGNTALFGFTIVFVDLLPPVFDPITLPPNVTINCVSNLPPVANVEATDNCADVDPPLTITYTQTNNAALCTGGTVLRKWIADDDGGNTSMYTQTITVLPDNIPPVIANNLQNGMAPCSTAMAQYTTWLNTQRANFSATDNGCGLMSLTDNAPSPAIITSFCGEVAVTFTAKDNCNNTSTVIKTFTIFNSVPPVIINPASGANGNCSQPNIASVFNNWIATHGGATASDDCSSIFWSTYPPSPSIADTCDAAIQVMFIAGDGCNNFDTTSASFILIDDTAPAITTTPTTMVLSCTAAGLDSILMEWLVDGGHSMAHDLCTPDAELELGYQLGNTELTLEEVLAAWQDSLESGCKDGVVINGIGINNVKALLEVKFTYDDNCDNRVSTTGFFGITDNGRPFFDTMPSNLSYTCSATQNWMDAFNTWYGSAGNADYADLCGEVQVNTNITADSAIAYLAAALDTSCLQGVSVTIQFTLEDECGNLSLTSPSATFSLGDTIPPVITTPASDFTTVCSATTQNELENWLDNVGGAVATDGCGDLQWSFSWTDTSGMVQTGFPEAGPYPQVGDLACNVDIDILFTVMDICQNTATDSAVFKSFDQTSPTIVIAEDTLHLSCKDTIPDLVADITDLCDPNPLITYQDSAGTNTCTGRPDFILRTITATDACGNSSTAQILILTIDIIPPTFELPADTISFCTVDTLTLLNISDNCDPNPLVTFNDELTGLVCQQTLNRTWIVTDACGNSSTAIQSFDLSDDAAPVIEYSPGNFVFACDTTAENLQAAYEQWLDSVLVSDACSASSYFIAESGSYILDDTSTWPGTPLPDSIMVMCGSSMTIVGDLVAYDECGNVLVEEISFSVNDTVGPVFTDCPAVISIAPDSTCTASVSLSAPAFEEICFPDDVKIQLVLDGGDSLDFNSIISLDTVLSVGIHTAVWIATDCNGNSGICSTSIEIIDENALTILCPVDTLIYTPADFCEAGIFIHATQTITAGCGLGVEAWGGFIIGNALPETFNFNSGDDSLFVLFAAGVHQVYLFAQDSTGDADTCSYQVVVQDTFPPGIVCQSDTLLLPPSGLDTIDLGSSGLVASATDACGLDTIVYDPPTVSCASNGQLMDITITVTDKNGNTSTCIASLWVVTAPLVPSWERGLCDDTLRLYANLPQDSLADYSYSWTGPNSFVSTDANPVLPNSDSTFSGTYTLTVQSGNGCISSGNTEVLIQELIAPVITTSADTLCAGGEIILTSQSFSGNVTYQWFQLVPSGDSLIQETTESQVTVVLTDPGVYAFFAVIVSDTCSSAPGPVVEVFVSDVPVASIATLPGILCISDTLFLLPASIIDSLQYEWNGPFGYSSSEPTPAGIPATDIDSIALYTLIVSNAFCTSVPDSVSIAVQLPPVTPVIDGDAQACEGGLIFLTASPAAENYTWIDPAATIVETDADTLFVSPVTMSQSGDWFVISYINGCPSDTSAGFTVQIDTAISIEIVTLTQVCEGDSITLAISPASTGSFSWTGPGGFTSDEELPTVLAENGTYGVTISTTTECEASDEIDVVVDVLPQVISVLTDADTCVTGNETIQLWAITQPGFNGTYEYHWTGPGTFTASDSSMTIQNVNASANGIYTVWITNGVCVSDTGSLELAVKDTPAEPDVTGSNTYCFGDTIVLTIANPVNNGVYAWSSNDTTAFIPGPGTFVLPNAILGYTGIYHVSVTVDGCTSTEASFGLQVKPPLVPPTITGTSFVCEGDSLLLHASAANGAAFTWTGPNGFTSNEKDPFIFPASVLASGTYTVSYELNGCTSIQPGTFEVAVQPALQTPELSADVSSLCIDAPVPVTLCITDGFVPTGGSYTWILNGNTIIEEAGTDTCITLNGNPLLGGDNLITLVSQLEGCPSDTTPAIVIHADEYPAQDADAGSPAAFCPEDIIFLEGSDPSPGTGRWTSHDPLVIFADDTNPNTEVLTLPSGQYTFMWTLSFATCINYSSDSVTVTVITPPLAFPDTVSVPFGQTDEFIVTLNDQNFNQAYTLEVVMNPQKGNALHIANGLFRYTPNIGFVGTDVMVYKICSTVCPEECSETTVIIRVGDESDCFVPSLFTPNEDGINDRLIIPCLESSLYPNNKIIIFNEWGDAVFTASPYQNDWEGTVSGESLPVGTYFYIMDFGDGRTPKRSFLIIER